MAANAGKAAADDPTSGGKTADEVSAFNAET